MLRAFFALPVPQAGLGPVRLAREAIEERSKRARLALRSLADESLHVTLCFLGHVALERLPEFRRVLDQSTQHPSVESGWTRLGAFPSTRNARVIVAELDDFGGRIAALARSIALACESLGVPRERRPFRPHVTLARLKEPGDVSDWLEQVELRASPVQFREVRLYQSELARTGSRYTSLARAELAEA